MHLSLNLPRPTRGGVLPLEHAPAHVRAALRNAWVSWLEDPAHQARQGTGQLFATGNNRVCAQGALALLLAEAGYARVQRHSVLICGERHTGTLGGAVATALGLPPALLARVSCWNDQGWSFAQIARALRRDLETLKVN